MGTGIGRADTGKFAVLKGKVEEIWITACGAARISIPGTTGDGDGNMFCCEIAKHSGAYVMASPQIQMRALFVPENCIDSYEGKVLRYDPSGGVEPMLQILEA
jgi:hypothetical protein